MRQYYDIHAFVNFLRRKTTSPYQYHTCLVDFYDRRHNAIFRNIISSDIAFRNIISRYTASCYIAFRDTTAR